MPLHECLLSRLWFCSRRSADRPSSRGKRTLAASQAFSIVQVAASSAAPYTHCVLPGNEASLMEEALARRPWWQPADPADAACGRFELWWGGNAQRYPATVFRSGTGPAVL